MKTRDLNKVKVEPIASSNALIFKKPGTKVRGFYRGVRKSKYEGREVIIHSLECADGSLRDVWESATLKNLGLVKPGAVVEILFHGMRKSENGKRKYKDFTLSVEPGGLRKGPRIPF